MENFKDSLLAEKEVLSLRLNAINELLRVYGVGTDESILFVEKGASRQNVNSTIFPMKATREKRILWLLENHFKRAVKLKEIGHAYKEFTGTEVSIDNVSRRQKREGKLTFVKYNGSPKLCYWGLPTWLDGNDYKDQHKSEDYDFLEVQTSEVVKVDE